MKSRLGEGVSKLPEGTLQARLTALIAGSRKEDKPLLRVGRDTGDHAAGLTIALHEIGLIGTIEAAMPAFGRASQLVRRGNELVVDPATWDVFKVPTGTGTTLEKTRNS